MWTGQPWQGVRRIWPTALRYCANKPLQSLKGCWQVSSHGRLCNTRGDISLGSLHLDGYRYATLLRQQWKVHRVVKITFHGLPQSEEAWQVHHLDGNSANNRLDNLEYVTQSENVLHSYSNPSRRSCGPALSKLVLWRPVGCTSWETSPSVRAAAHKLGMHKETVARCCRKNSAAKGYEFKYQDVKELALPGEEWRPMVDPVSGSEVRGRMVSSLGRVTLRTGLVSAGQLNKQGYYLTEIRASSLRRSVRIHRLVAFAFLGSPPADRKQLVNHKDLDKGNNAVDNLEWVSPAENVAHFYATSTHRPGKTTIARPVWSRRQGTDAKWTWHRSMASAANELGLDSSDVSRCARGLRRQTCGYEFELADTSETDSSLAGEEWRRVDLFLLQRDKEHLRRHGGFT